MAGKRYQGARTATAMGAELQRLGGKSSFNEVRGIHRPRSECRIPLNQSGGATAGGRGQAGTAGRRVRVDSPRRKGEAWERRPAHPLRLGEGGDPEQRRGNMILRDLVLGGFFLKMDLGF